MHELYHGRPGRKSMHFVFFIVISLFLKCSLSPLQAQLTGYQTIAPEEVFDISFQDEHGQEHHLRDFKGKVILINFWATYCGPCLQEMPSINNLGETFKPDELVLLTICTDPKSKEQAKSIFHMGNYKHLPLFFDHQGALKNKLKARGIPLTLLLNEQHQIIGKLEGSTEWDHYENVQHINDLIAGKVVTAPPSFFDRIFKWFKRS
jgi:thiol-disulfide isomerase/thioredoxin